MRILMFGGLEKSCFDFVSGDRKSSLTLCFVGAKDEVVS